MAFSAAVLFLGLFCLPSLILCGLVIPVQKDETTLQYVAHIQSRTPATKLKLVVDLGSRYTWVECSDKYVSSSYRPVHCNTPECSLIATAYGCGDCLLPPSPGCSNQSCSVDPESPTLTTIGELVQDAFHFHSTEGSVAGPLVTASDYVFACAPHFLLKGLASGASGMLALGRGRIGLPIQLAVEFRLAPKFAICLSSASTGGAIFVGDGPYKFQPNPDSATKSRALIDVTKFLEYTDLLINPVSTSGTYIAGEKSVDHFVGVEGIKVGGKALSLNKKLLSIDDKGVGGTKISMTAPYTVLETSVYKAVMKAIGDAIGSKPSKSVAPFKVCYDADSMGAAPSIELVLQNASAPWALTQGQYMVFKSYEGVLTLLCPGFVDGGESPRTSIVIGGYQLEDRLLQFDLKKRRLGYTSSLFDKDTDCGRFSFKGKHQEM